MNEEKNKDSKIYTLGVTIGMSINNASNYVNEQFYDLSPEEWGRQVIKYSKALLKEMKKEGLI